MLLAAQFTDIEMELIGLDSKPVDSLPALGIFELEGGSHQARPIRLILLDSQAYQSLSWPVVSVHSCSVWDLVFQQRNTN